LFNSFSPLTKLKEGEFKLKNTNNGNSYPYVVRTTRNSYRRRKGDIRRRPKKKSQVAKTENDEYDNSNSVFARLGPKVESRKTRGLRYKKDRMTEETHSVNMTYVTFDGVDPEDFDELPEVIEEATMVNNRKPGRPKGSKSKEGESGQQSETEIDMVQEGLDATIEEANQKTGEQAYTTTINAEAELARTVEQYNQQLYAMQVKNREVDDLLKSLRQKVVIEEHDAGTSKNTTRETESVKATASKAKASYRDTTILHLKSDNRQSEEVPTITIPIDQLQNLVQNAVDGTMGKALTALGQNKNVPSYRRGTPYPKEYDNVPYPVGYVLPIFNRFAGDGKESPEEHLANFKAACRDTAHIEELLFRQWLSSLKGRAHNWVCSLPEGSIKTWEQMEDAFVSKFALVTEKITMSELFNTMPRPKENNMDYMRRWRNLSMQCEESVPEATAVNAIIRNIGGIDAISLRMSNVCNYFELQSKLRIIEDSHILKPPQVVGSRRPMQAEAKTVTVERTPPNPRFQNRPEN
jgi:hypothetical protein